MKRIVSLLLTIVILMTMVTNVAAEDSGVDLSASITNFDENTVWRGTAHLR